jgi:GT2 family glycosyltransferase
MSSRIYIVLVNWNGWRDTIECLESVFRLEYDDYSVVVCDNDSTDGSFEQIRAWARGEQSARESNPDLAHLVRPPISKPIRFAEYGRAAAECGGTLSEEFPLVLIQTGGNLGFAGGNNVGFRYAIARGDAEYVWALNNDTVVERNALAALVTRSEQAAGRGIVGSTLVFYSVPDQVQALGCARYSKRKSLGAPIGLGSSIKVVPRSPSAVEGDAAYVVGASMLVPRVFIEEVGLMCEDYFLYFEELDWAERGRMRGFRPLYAPLSIVYHKVGASTHKVPRGRRLALSEKCSYKNRLLVTKRFFPREQLWVKCRLALEGIRALLRGRTEEARFVLNTILEG